MRWVKLVYRTLGRRAGYAWATVALTRPSATLSHKGRGMRLEVGGCERAARGLESPRYGRGHTNGGAMHLR